MSENFNSKTMETKEKNGNRKNGVALLVVGIVILVVIVAFLVVTIFVSPAKTNDWYAVFLTNGRTYFGNIVKQNSQTVSLKNIYYLQVQQLDPQVEGEQPQTQLSLMSVADELHSPENEMHINREHILYFQKLRKDSQVVVSIEQKLK